MANKHVFILVHGMTTDPAPGDHLLLYQGFLDRLTSQEPRLNGRLDEHTFVEWGYQPPSGTGLRPDEHLTSAQAFLAR